MSVPAFPHRSLTGFCLALALWPILAVHGAYFLSLWQGTAPACFPYIEGCTSISRAGRHGLANLWFKAAMLPYAAMLALFWWLARQWLRTLAGRDPLALWLSGTMGAAFLVLYATFLGTEGEVYQLMRRYGIYVYFGGTFIAQILLVGRMRELPRKDLRRVAAWQLACCWLVLLIGLLTVAAYALPMDRDALQNAVEWCAALLMQGYFLFTARAWWLSGFRVGFACHDRTAEGVKQEPPGGGP